MMPSTPRSRRVFISIGSSIVHTCTWTPAARARRTSPVDVTSNLAQRLDEGVESAAYYVAAEAVTNALKYAAASRIEVLVELGDALSVTISDDGIGGVAETRVGHEENLGLVGLCDRVNAFDGTVSVTSPQGVGTTLRAEFPISARVDLDQQHDADQPLR